MLCWPTSDNEAAEGPKQADRRRFCEDWRRLVLEDMSSEIKQAYSACVRSLKIVKDSPFEITLHIACRKIAEARADGEFELAQHFDYGRGIEQDGWCKRAAEHGYPRVRVAATIQTLNRPDKKSEFPHHLPRF